MGCGLRIVTPSKSFLLLGSVLHFSPLLPDLLMHHSQLLLLPLDLVCPTTGSSQSPQPSSDSNLSPSFWQWGIQIIRPLPRRLHQSWVDALAPLFHGLYCWLPLIATSVLKASLRRRPIKKAQDWPLRETNSPLPICSVTLKDVPFLCASVSFRKYLLLNFLTPLTSSSPIKIRSKEPSWEPSQSSFWNFRVHSCWAS